MMIEQEMVIVSEQDLAEYKAKHSAPAPKVQFFTARIPDNSFDKAKLQRLENENAELRAELNDYKKAYETERRRNDQIATIGNAAREKQQAEAERRYKEYEDHIAKLERALIEATLR